MKLKYIFASIVATLALAGCTKEAEQHFLKEIKVSSSYVSLAMTGASNTITVTATENWSISVPEKAAEWLTVTPTSGSAGETQVTFSAPATLDGRNAEIIISGNTAKQHINVIQGLATVSDATCAEVIAGPDSKTYRVTGTCTRIANTSYGNWYLEDATGEIYIYGTVDGSGKYNWASFGIEVGDEVTVQGPKTTYNGTVELVDVSVVKVNKSLIKVDSVDPEDATIAKEGGDLTVTLTNKGKNLGFIIPEEAKAWLGATVVDDNVVILTAAANEGGDRKTTVIFSTNDGKKDYTAELEITQKGAIIETSVKGFLDAPVSETQYRITAVISSVANAQYGNVYLRDFSGETYVYGIGAKGDFEKAGLKEGDIVTLVGKRGEYKGTAQMTGAQLEKSISVTPVTPTEFVTMPDSKDVYYMVTGVITTIDNATYGNLHFTDGTTEVYVYGCYPGYGATGDARKNWVDNAEGKIEVGDMLTMIGYKDTYNGTIELCGGIYFSHEKANPGEGGEGEGAEEATEVSFSQEQLAAAAGNGATVKMNDIVSFTNSSDYGSNTVTELRIYKNQSLAFSAADGYVLTKIEVVCTADGTAKYGPGSFGEGAPSGYTFDAEGPNGKWEGSSNSVNFTATDNQVRIKELKVSFAKAE